MHNEPVATMTRRDLERLYRQTLLQRDCLDERCEDYERRMREMRAELVVAAAKLRRCEPDLGAARPVRLRPTAGPPPIRAAKKAPCA